MSNETRPTIPTIAITTGEPAGVGPDICIKLASQPQTSRLVFIGCPELISQRAAQLGQPIKIKHFDAKEQPSFAENEMEVLPETTSIPVTAGHLDERNSHYVLRLLQHAVDGCKQGIFDAITTAPLHKGIINKAGIPFSGHTEWLAEATGTSRVVMMLACKGLRVALATTHLPLSQVSSTITPTLLQDILLIIHKELQQKFCISNPHILVCGLNPHAGEDGHLGREELDIIIPTLNQCREQGIRLTGPLPADTLFSPTNLQTADVVLAMYHDQGLPVLKFKGFGEAVNITLGLPMIRTSVDHGTALDLASTGLAHATSLKKAVQYAESMLKTTG